MPNDKKNPSILLGSGEYFDYVNPDASKLTIEDYAAGLAFQSRFQGQCAHSNARRIYYSIAQHVVLGSYAIHPDHAYEFLMHESGETVCGDMVRPLKQLCPEFLTVEHRCEKPINERFGVVIRAPELVKSIDLRMWITERNQLMNWDGKPWSGENFGDPDKQILPLDIKIQPIGPYEAYDLFLARWRELKPEHVE